MGDQKDSKKVSSTLFLKPSWLGKTFPCSQTKLVWNTETSLLNKESWYFKKSLNKINNQFDNQDQSDDNTDDDQNIEIISSKLPECAFSEPKEYRSPFLRGENNQDDNDDDCYSDTDLGYPQDDFDEGDDEF